MTWVSILIIVVLVATLVVVVSSPGKDRPLVDWSAGNLRASENLHLLVAAVAGGAPLPCDHVIVGPGPGAVTGVVTWWDGVATWWKQDTGDDPLETKRKKDAERRERGAVPSLGPPDHLFHSSCYFESLQVPASLTQAPSVLLLSRGSPSLPSTPTVRGVVRLCALLLVRFG